MRRLRELNQYRDRERERAIARMFGEKEFADNQDLGGCFLIPGPRGRVTLRVHAGVGDGWEHLSISLPLRTPSWEEMEHVKRLFFRPDEIAFQLHVPPSAHINVHPHCLHIWRPIDGPIPTPPSWMV
jgi:hypothetical protein